uniref:Predicted protein n=1 Tax=Hordeum vulgare subsp. vulgare TaxID=112509 RepID=F2DS58_HORVV|nr:predicted protein [Hordeum vulgare subsp. vulgare]
MDMVVCGVVVRQRRGRGEGKMKRGGRGRRRAHGEAPPSVDLAVNGKNATHHLHLRAVTQVNIWSYANHEVLHKIDIDHLENVFCTKFIEETSDEVLV